MEEAKSWISLKIGKNIISFTGLNMEQQLGKLLYDKQKTIAVAESCTGGLIADMLTNVAGSSDYFILSAVTYSNDAKIKVLKVKQDTIVKYGAVLEQTALEMAEGVRKISGADYALSTSGIAGPGGGTKDKPVGTVCIAISGDSFSKSKKYEFSFKDRNMNKKIFAATALELLRRELEKLEI